MTVPETTEPRRHFVLPADYYSSPTVHPVMPTAAAYGCGAAAVLFLALLFAGGAYLSTGGFTRFMDFVLGMSIGEMRGMYGEKVTSVQKQSLESEIEQLRAHLRADRVSVGQMQPFLQAMQSSMDDGKVSSEEAARLESTVRNINRGASPAQPR